MDLSWVAGEYLGCAGRLAMSSSPGCHPGSTLEQDLGALVEAGISLVVCLQEEQELFWLDEVESIDDRRRAVEALGTTFLHAPIEDFMAPDLGTTRTVLEALFACLDHGSDALVHCYAGLGRTGTVVACALVSRGMCASDAILLTRWLRPGAIQSGQQERFIARFDTRNP